MTKESAKERLERIKREKEESKANTTEQSDIVKQLTHEDSGAKDFSQLAEKLQAIKDKTAQGENDGFVKMTIYIREDIARSFDALCVQRGDQKRLANEALADFVGKKARELGL